MAHVEWHGRPTHTLDHVIDAMSIRSLVPHDLESRIRKQPAWANLQYEPRQFEIVVSRRVVW